ncbi:MAG: helix-turn-helix domain-containing protein [Balneolaceae bacterium]
MTNLEVLFVSLMLFGALQGIVLGISLWKNDFPQKTAHRFLASILLFFSYRLIVESLRFFDIGFYDIWYHLLLEYNWIYGALIFFFVASYINPKFELILKKHWIHFLPVLIEFAFSNFIKTQNFYWDGTRESLSWAGYYGYILWMHTPFNYLVSGLLILFYSFKSWMLLADPPEPKGYLVLDEHTSWLKNVIFVLSGFSILFMLVGIIDYLFFNYMIREFYIYPMFIGMSLITYWLGLQGFSRREKSPVKILPELSRDNQSTLTELAKKLSILMEKETVYKDPELNLAKLSELLQAKPYLITQTLNLVIGKKFSDYVNEYRLEEVKRLMNSTDYSHFTLLAIANEAGFNSKASFNRIVKKLTGKPPSDLKK